MSCLKWIHQNVAENLFLVWTQFSLFNALCVEIHVEDFCLFRIPYGKQQDAGLSALHTKSDPRGELAEGHSVGVIALGVEQFEADVDEGLQHGRPSSGAWLSPFRLPDGSVYIKRGQRLLPVHRLHGQGERRQSKNIPLLRQELPGKAHQSRGRSIKTNFGCINREVLKSNFKPFMNQKSVVYIHSWIIYGRLRGAARTGKENVPRILITPKLLFFRDWTSDSFVVI